MSTVIAYTISRNGTATGTQPRTRTSLMHYGITHIITMSSLHSLYTKLTADTSILNKSDIISYNATILIHTDRHTNTDTDNK